MSPSSTSATPEGQGGPEQRQGHPGHGHDAQDYDDEVRRLLATTNLPAPLSPADVADRRTHFGPNVIVTKTKVTWYSILLAALFHPFNILLGILATATGSNAEYDGMGVMLVMILISTTIRFFQEFKSAKAAESLSGMVKNTVRVLRQQRQRHEGTAIAVSAQEIPLEDLVPGDWVTLAAGSLIPADIVLLKSKDLLVSQASLTGEAIPVEKCAGDPSERSQSSGAAKSEDSQNIFMDISIGEAGKIDSTTRLDGVDPPTVRVRAINLLRSLFGLPVYRQFGGSIASLVAPQLDNPSLCYLGTSVVSGTCLALVTSTGPATYFGSMAHVLAKAQPPNAFQLGVRRISWIFFLTMAALVPPVLLLQGFINKDWREAFLFSLAVAVGFTPEMLPMIVSATLARGAYVLSRKKVIVKNMDSIINLGGMDVLCTDKTGTLTENCVSLSSHVDFFGQEAALPAQLGFLNAWFQTGLRNLLDDAVVQFLKGTTDLSNSFRLVDEIPFDFVRRRMSVLLKETKQQVSGELLLISKGAVEEMLAICTHVCLPSKSNHKSTTSGQHNLALPPPHACQPLTDEMRAQLARHVASFNADGLRAIAVAFKRIAVGVPGPSEAGLNKSDESDMTFAGFLGFREPPKASAAPAINTLLQANVCVKVLTGDSAEVCAKICTDIQLPVARIVTSSELDEATVRGEAHFTELVQSGTIFAKLTPLQKADVVRALKKAGHVVGFLGDGINDAPALAEADIGISVDNGSDIARDSANIILLEKDLSVVADGVFEGRKTYGNTMKYIVMAMSSNFGNVFSVLVAAAWLKFVPMQAIHILAQNLLYDISQIAIPWDNMDPEFLAVPHRWSMKSVLLFMVFMGPWSSVFDITTFLYMYFYHGIQTPQDNVRLFQTAWFTVGLLTQTLIVHMIRTPKVPFFQSIASPPLLVMTGVIMATGLALPYIPGISDYLDFVRLEWDVYPFVAAVLIAYCCIAQAAKVVYIKLFKKWY